MIEDYDPARNAIGAVKPMLNRATPAANGGVTGEELPEIYDVPVSWPILGSFQFTMPISIGDVVLVVFPDYDIQAWRSSGQQTDPGDARRHHLAGAIALPCALRTLAQPMQSYNASALEFGHSAGLRVATTLTQMQVGGTSDAAALASKVDELAATVNALVALYNAHGHGGGGASAPSTPADSYSGGASASARLKVGG